MLFQVKATTVTAPPDPLPLIVSLTEAKQQVRTDSDEDDAFVASLIPVVQAWLQQAFAFSLFTQGVRMTLDCWPLDTIPVPLGPVNSITEISYIDSAGVTQIVDPATYYLDPSRQPERLALNFNQQWPTAQLRGPGSIFVDFEAGYGAASEDVPGPIKQAALLLIGHYFLNREQVITEPGVTQVSLQFGVEALMTLYLHR